MFHTGQQIGIYTLIKRIGRGGFGEVWLAERRAKFVTTKVAVKLPLDDQVDHDAIKQEAMLWEQASGHPNILPIIDADEYDGQVVIVSEFAPDGSLEQWLKEHGTMPVEDAVEMTVQILNGLEFLHSRRIIHRDLKPANILLQGNTPRLADFGISRALRTTIASQSQHISGTFAYMSPEALDGKRSERTDIWSVGVNLYRFIMGSLPFPQKEPSVLFPAIIMRDYVPLPDSIPDEVCKVLAKALAKLPENRYQTAREMRDDLRQFLRSSSQSSVRPEPIEPTPSSGVSPPIEVCPLSLESPPVDPQSLVRSEGTETIVRVPGFPTTPPSPVQEYSPGPERVPRGRDARAAYEKAEALVHPASPRMMVNFGSEAERVDPVVRPPVIATALADKRARRRRNLLYIGAPAGLVLAVILLMAGGVWLYVHRTRIPFRQGDKFGFQNRGREFVIEPTYDLVEPFHEGLARVTLNKKIGFIDKTGAVVVPIVYDKAEWEPDYLMAAARLGGPVNSFEDHLIHVTANGLSGCIDTAGSIVVPLKYSGVQFFSEGLAVVADIGKKEDQNDDKFGFVDLSGNEVIPVKYGGAHQFIGGLAFVKWNGKWGAIDKRGNEVVPFVYEDAANDMEFIGLFYPDQLSKTLFSVKLSSGWGAVDKSNRTIIPFKYSSLTPFSTGYVLVTFNGKDGLLDEAGNEKISAHFNMLGYPVDGLIAAQIDNKWGFVDTGGKTVIPFEYDSTSIVGFVDGLVRVRKGDKEGFINTKGIEIVPIKFEKIGEKMIFAPTFSDGIACLKNNGLYGGVDRKGNEVIPFKYKKEFAFVDGFASVDTGDGRPFYIDTSGTEFHQP